ncbi:unnamed protein product [Brachionus calyciflorus]|uniref:DnaJ homolog subfamily B member 9 n=1 Tax=Brachionus calyciflorus TaxID=104777 RepID=A0A813LZT0_9BILA|nr:unnamed protein product [Brachionus calyciflorus]
MDFFSPFLFLIISLFFLVECKNYYDVLGVQKTDSTAQIKKAFRNLAMKYHPDKNPDKSAEVKFREIVEAYEVLSDPDKRKTYDQQGDTNFNGQQFDSSGFDFHEFFKGFDEAMRNHHEQHHQQHHHFHEKAHREHMKAHHGFMFDFDDLFSDSFDLFGNHDMFGGGGDDGFGSLLGDAFHQEININQNGMNCRTVKKKQGNTVFTHTECH